MDKEILENIDIDIDIDKEILENIDIDKKLNRIESGISNRASWTTFPLICWFNIYIEISWIRWVIWGLLRGSLVLPIVPK